MGSSSENYFASLWSLSATKVLSTDHAVGQKYRTILYHFQQHNPIKLIAATAQALVDFSFRFVPEVNKFKFRTTATAPYAVIEK